MWPLYKEGDYVLALNRRLCSLKKGDCIVFRHDIYGCIIKKISDVKDKSFYVEGTTRSSMDSASLGWVPRSEIVAKVICRIPCRSKRAC
ncbi:MAG: S26 family signal peptidase [Lentisphaeraceae bacterium]|nr:S26 family signal peptidase [Lentisphaeraceae bacterium]